MRLLSSRAFAGTALLVAGLLLMACAASSSASSKPASTPGRGPVIEFWNGTTWTQQADPIPGGFGLLSAIAARSADDAWAVGSYTSTVGALAEHWDGSAWRKVSVPIPAGVHVVSLSGVATISSTDAWAVGESGRGPSQRALIEHWDGSAWTMVDNLPLQGRAGLSAVVASSATSVWVAGFYRGRPLFLHWNGQQWKRVPNPAPRTASVSGMATVGKKAVWAVGFHPVRNESYSYSYRTLVLHWNGRKWKRVPSPTPHASGGFSGVTALGRSDVWAVGGYRNGYGFRLLTEHWNGRSWRIVRARASYGDVDGLGFTSVAARHGNHVWAAGLWQEPGACYHGIVYHWNGRSWSPRSVPKVTDVQFSAIAEASPHAVWVLANYAEC